jgi:hypothetical protein
VSITATRNPIEIRKAGLRALTAALGHDDAQFFLMQYRGSGDFTKERHEMPDKSFDEIAAEILELEAATTA